MRRSSRNSRAARRSGRLSDLPMALHPELVVDGLAWPESLRWYAGALWISDVHNFRVVRVEPGTAFQVVATAPGRPSGMAFAPDGRLLLATALDKKLWWVLPKGELELAVDLSGQVSGVLNDMIVDAHGRAWVGDTGFDLLRGESPRPGALLTWQPGEDSATVAAADLDFPNGMAISADGAKFYIAETFGRRITAFDAAPGGRLTRRRVHAPLTERPDGLCLDAAGALWVPLLWQQEIQRVSSTGEVLDRIQFENERAISCVLGGPERRTLFIGIARMEEVGGLPPRRFGAVVRVRVDTPGAGIP
jgi:sugar lactone lactonase YvrE